MVRGSGKCSGLISFRREGLRGQAAERGMRPVLVVMLPPLLDPIPGIRHRQEPGSIQAFGSQAAVEGFDIGVIGGIQADRHDSPQPEPRRSS